MKKDVEQEVEVPVYQKTTNSLLEVSCRFPWAEHHTLAEGIFEEGMVLCHGASSRDELRLIHWLLQDSGLNLCL